MSSSSVVLLSSLCGGVGDASLENAKRGGYRLGSKLEPLNVVFISFAAQDLGYGNSLNSFNAE